MNKKNNHSGTTFVSPTSRSKLWVVCLLSFVACSFAVHALAAEPEAQFNQANDLYRSGKFEEAAQLFEQVIQASAPASSPELHFNLANALYRAGKNYEAIYQYEQALAKRPWYADARFNLNAVRSKIEYKIEDRRNPFIRFNDWVLKWVRVSQLEIGVLFCLFVFLILVGFWLRNSNRQFFWNFPRVECFSILLLFSILLGAKVFYSHHYGEAIVLASEAEVRYGPAMDNQSVMKLGGGLKVFIVDSRDDWSRVIAWNGETGWMRNSELGKINP